MSAASSNPQSPTRGRRRIQRGRVRSDKRDKTITVVFEWTKPHPLYGKYVKQRTVVQAHDANNEAREGDLVEVQETRPLSKTKRWRLVQIVERARLTAAEARAADDTSDAQTGPAPAAKGKTTKEPSA